MTGTITITFGDQAENHAGMQKIGQIADKGLSVVDLRELNQHFTAESELIELSDDAAILIFRNYAEDPNSLFNEILNLKFDSKALMYGRVVNKQARHNLCFADFDQQPDYEHGKGTIIDFKKLKFLNSIRKSLIDRLNINISLVAEANYYYDLEKCYIGWHGDSERKIVVGLRLGESIPLFFRWYEQGEPISEIIKIELSHGDLYLMSEKATGNDWKKKGKHLRHCAGLESTLRKKKIL